MQVLKCNASQRRRKENETALQARLEAIIGNYRENVDKDDEENHDKRLQNNAMKVRQYRANQNHAQAENDREKARMRMQTIRRKQATLAAMQEQSKRKDENLQLTDDNEESTMKGGVKIPILVNSVDTKQLTKSEITKHTQHCLLYTSPSPRDRQKSRMPSSA